MQQRHLATLCTQNSIYVGEFDLNIKYAGLFATWPQTYPYRKAQHHQALTLWFQARCDVVMLLLSAGIKEKTKQERGGQIGGLWGGERRACGACWRGLNRKAGHFWHFCL